MFVVARGQENKDQARQFRRARNRNPRWNLTSDCPMRWKRARTGWISINGKSPTKIKRRSISSLQTRNRPLVRALTVSKNFLVP